MLKIFSIVIIIAGLTSCNGLRKSQVAATQNFAIATRGISRVPSDIYYRIYLLKGESQTLQLNSLLATNNKSKESIAMIKNDYDEKISFLNLAEEYSSAYLIVEQYADLVLCLLDDKALREFVKTKDAWQVSFDRLVARYNITSATKIPPSVGRLTANIILELGKLKLKDLQQKYLREAIHTAREPFENICDDFVLLDSLKIRSELNTLPAHLNNNYGNFLDNVRAYEKEGNNPFQYYRDYTPIYTNWLSEVNDLGVLSTSTVGAFRRLKNTFGILEDYVNGKGSKTYPPQIDSLMTEYGNMVSMYNKFEYRRQKLNAASLIK